MIGRMSDWISHAESEMNNQHLGQSLALGACSVNASDRKSAAHAGVG